MRVFVDCKSKGVLDSFFFFSSRRRHTRWNCDWSSDVCSSDLHPKAIAGVDPDPGAVEADVLRLYHDSLIGFDALEPAFLTDLTTRSLPHGGAFLDLSYDKR